MMIGMAHSRRSVGRPAALAALALLAAGCSATPPDDPEQSPESAALRVETVSGTDGLDEQTVTALEGEVGDVLSGYVVEAFLGKHPREEFVSAFDAFTSRAARAAAADFEVLSAARVPDATAVRATELDARLSFLTRDGEVHGGTAAVHFAFEATLGDGTTQPLTLDGRFLLDADRGTWSVFGYDVRLDDGSGVDAEATS
jgi:hypothetical protein